MYISIHFLKIEKKSSFFLRQLIIFNISLFSIVSFMDGVLLITQDQH